MNDVAGTVGGGSLKAHSRLTQPQTAMSGLSRRAVDKQYRPNGFVSRLSPPRLHKIKSQRSQMTDAMELKKII